MNTTDNTQSKQSDELLEKQEKLATVNKSAGAVWKYLLIAIVLSILIPFFGVLISNSGYSLMAAPVYAGFIFFGFIVLLPFIMLFKYFVGKADESMERLENAKQKNE
ncbi:hypothetical protein HZU75_12015 [Chitinibacter fontanus]|uniref:DUF485 domain-containing protein n=1 Tax=Chitinibacter fontanus TaxID=1737446 RepID=A0A7D5VBI0_9NEIS|nr:hypothetical protein [Chitinibacter fontanus]QLI82193.1 hypothetical protein HZU75_12015 [Chitinibacter fontanus]